MKAQTALDATTATVDEFLPAPALAQFKAAHEAMKDAQLVLQTIGVCFGLQDGDNVDSTTGKITRKATNK